MPPLHPNEKTPLSLSSSTMSVNTLDLKAGSDDIYESENANSNVVDVTTKYQLYKQRWWVLFTFCMLNFTNGWIWVTWSPINTIVSEYWNVDESSVDALSGIYLYVFVPMNIVSMWLVVNYLGLGKGLLTGSILNMMGCIVRYKSGAIASASVATSGFHWTDYHVVYAGTFLCAVGQTLIFPVVALVSGSWFGELERGTATSLGLLAYQTGMLIGLGSTVVVDFRDSLDGGPLNGDTLDRYLFYQLCTSMFSLSMVLLNLRRDKPPTPPSEAAAALTQNDTLSVKYMDSVRLLLKNPSCWTFFLLYGMTIGVFYAIPTFLSQFMPSWSPREQGSLGGIFQMGAVSGCFSAGKLLSWYHLQYQKVGIFLLSGCLVSIVLYLVSVYYQSYMAMMACAGLGFFFSSFMSVGIEFGTALTYPADEGAVYGLLDSTAELTGFLLVTLGGSMSHKKQNTEFCGILVCLIALALALFRRHEGSPRRPSSHYS